MSPFRLNFDQIFCAVSKFPASLNLNLRLQFAQIKSFWWLTQVNRLNFKTECTQSVSCFDEQFQIATATKK